MVAPRYRTALPHIQSRPAECALRVVATAIVALLAACGGSDGDDGASAVFTMSADDLPDEAQEFVTPVADGDIFAIDGSGQGLFFTSVDASVDELLAVLRETSGLDIAFPRHVPDGFVLESGVLTRSPVPSAGTDEGFRTSVLVWATEPANPFHSGTRGTRVAIERWPGAISLNPEDMTIAELDDGWHITAPVYDDMPEGALSPGYYLHPPDGGEDPVTYILNVHPMVDAEITEEEIVAMLASLVE